MNNDGQLLVSTVAHSDDYPGTVPCRGGNGGRFQPLRKLKNTVHSLENVPWICLLSGFLKLPSLLEQESTTRCH